MSPTAGFPATGLFRTPSSRVAACRAVMECLLLLGLAHSKPLWAAPESRISGNALSYLESADPFYVGTGFPKLTTPQWIGEPGVEAVVVLAVDDMTDSARYEKFLRPLLERLKQIDGRAPVSIMTRSIAPGDPQVQAWLKEGLALEVHTLQHPCPLLANGDFEAAATNYYDCLDLLNRVPGNKPVAFRMPCCDSMDSTSPRFFAELFNHPSPQGNFLAIDSSVMDLLTASDPSLRQIITAADGTDRFRKYFPTATNSLTRVSLGAFATTIENYPYPYLINRLCWEFPCVVPSDWEAMNCHGPTNALTIQDWKAALDAVVLKQGVFTMIFHPYGWVRAEQLVQLVDYAVSQYGTRIKFLTFREALERMNRNLLMGQAVRGSDGSDNGVRLLDLNGDGYLDLIVANQDLKRTRIWHPSARRWAETDFPASLVSGSRDLGFHFGVVQPGRVTAFFRNETAAGAWSFDGEHWRDQAAFFNGLTLRGQPVMTAIAGRDRGVRLHDVDADGRCELVLGNESQNAVFQWSEAESSWKKLPFALPEGTSIVDAAGQDSGLRFVDLNGDGHDDVLFSNPRGYSVHLFIAHPKPWLGWEVGWSYQVRAGRRDQPGALPMISRGGARPNNGVWFHAGRLWAQNEDTSGLPDKAVSFSFNDLQLGGESSPKSVAEELASFHVASGFQVELVASEPAVVDPVAFDWGPDGKLWVVEMRDYPLGLDNHGKPGGVVRFLEDTDADGHYDKSTVFLEGIGFPNGIMVWGKGVLVSAAPDIFYAEDSDGDGRADVRRLLYTGFREGNQQHRVNGFEYGLDNWIYAANGGSGGVVRSVGRNQELNLRGHDLRIRPREGLMELQPGATQFGRHRDDWGDWFGNDNSRWLWHYYLPERYVSRNRYLSVNSLSRLLANYPDSTRLFALSRPQQRFNWPNALFEVTSACSAAPYRDALFGPDFDSSVFICEPANNLIHREVLVPSGVSFLSHRGLGETNSEFFASTDNWCRPVMVKTGPDGALYFADMYRLIIEHPEYFPEELKHRPDLRAGDDKGRLYRIYPKGAHLRAVPRLDRLDTAGLVAALDSLNGWQRDTVQRLLVQNHDLRAAPMLEQLAATSSNPKARLQALCTLAGLQSLSQEVLVKAASDSHWAVRREALVLGEERFGQSANLDAAMLAREHDPDLRVRYQLALSLGNWNSSEASLALGRLMLEDGQIQDMRTALLSSCLPHLDRIVQELFRPANTPRLAAELAEALVTMAAQVSDPPVLATVLERLASPSGPSAWRVAGLAGFLDALDRRGENWAQYQTAADAPVQRALARLEPLFQSARELAQDASAPEPERLTAIRVVGRGPLSQQETGEALLGDLLEPQQSVPIQQAALAALQGSHRSATAQVLLRRWRGCGLNLRQGVLNTLLSRPEWVDAVLTALEKGKLLPGELGPLQRQKLLNHPDAGVRARSARLFSNIDPDRRKIVEAYGSVSTLKGNRANGHELFTKNCSICHRLAGEGQTIGPDLGTMADKPVQELVLAILDPNQAVDPAYVAYTAVTKDDRELSGILAAESANSISLRLAGGTEVQLLRQDLKELTTSGRSLMPEGFESGLKPQDLADLIAYILNPDLRSP